MEHYITEICIEKLRHLSDVRIVLSHEKRMNLLLTGKNGSGKTTVLEAIKQYLQLIGGDFGFKYWSGMFWSEKMFTLEVPQNIGNDSGSDMEKQEFFKWLGGKKNLENYVVINEISGIDKLYDEGKFLMAYYGAARKTGIQKSKGVENVVLERRYPLDSNPGYLLHQYLVHLKTQQSYARNEGDMEVVQMLDTWFERFTNALRILLDNQSIQLKYDYKSYDFLIMEDGRRPYGFDQLSDGYSAAIQIVTDLILRMEQNWLTDGILSSYDVEGIVMIDELETHLHIGLQRKILPFLTEFFPRIQFIVSTHSPYILNSVENCVIYDMEKHIRMEDMSGYSAEGIVEGYFEFESYSEILLQKVRRYEALVNKESPTEEERVERAKLLVEMKQLSGDLAREAKDAFEEIEQRRKQYDKVQSH